MFKTTLILCYLQVTELQIDINHNGGSQVIEETEEDDDVGDFEGIIEGSDDDEYVPAAESSPSAPPTSTARKRKTQSNTDKNKTGQSALEDSKNKCVQCPVCDKTFKSKYYLKVHNRYTVSPSRLPYLLLCYHYY